jgi:hypothetical protein
LQEILKVYSTAKFTIFHVNSREFTKFHTFSREFTLFHESFFLLVWTANKAKHSLASHGLFHKKSFVLKTIHVTSSYRKNKRFFVKKPPSSNMISSCQKNVCTTISGDMDGVELKESVQ